MIDLKKNESTLKREDYIDQFLEEFSEKTPFLR